MVWTGENLFKRFLAEHRGQRLRGALGRRLRLRRVLRVVDARRWTVERSHRERLASRGLDPL